MPLLQIANLTKTYHMSDELSQDVLKGIDAHFNKGEMVALLGESGCGKSTLLNILGGLDSEFGGSVIYNGEFFTDFTPEQLDDYRKSKVGIVFQGFNLVSHLTALDNVILPMKMANWDSAERTARAKELLTALGLKKHLNKRPNQLSGGQRQRVAIARALANDPEIILADEPTGNLDKDSAEDIIKILQEIAQNKKLVIVVTHSEKVASGCSRVIKMGSGKFVSTTYNTVKEKKKEDKILEAEIAEVDSRSAKPISAGELLKFAATNLFHQRSRTIFVAFGTSVGIIALILMIALSVGLRGYVNNEVTGNVSLLQINVQKNSSQNGVSGHAEHFLPADISYLKNVPYVDRVETATTLNLSATYEYNSQTGDVLTLTSAHESYYPSLVEPESLSNPLSGYGILISRSLANKLLSSSASYSVLINKTITITMNDTYENKSQKFYIAGVIESDEALNNFASVVITSQAMSELAPDAPVTNAFVFAASANRLDAIMSEVGALFSAYRVDTTVEDILYFINLGTGVLIVVCAVSLVVSAIMIFIVMNISIVERTKEIGILRAIGARQKDVRRIFVFESGTIGALAGLIACIICLIITAGVNIVLSVELGYSLISWNPLIYLGGLAISILVSVFSGILPAHRASDADPVESLRRE